VTGWKMSIAERGIGKTNPSQRATQLQDSGWKGGYWGKRRKAICACQSGGKKLMQPGGCWGVIKATSPGGREKKDERSRGRNFELRERTHKKKGLWLYGRCY